MKKDFLLWLKSKLKDGYIRERNDEMSEYTIVGFDRVERILKLLLPFLRLKKPQAKLTLEVIKEIPKKKRGMYTAKLLLKLDKKIDKFKQLNYSKKEK